jgi:hypothetical protein
MSEAIARERRNRLCFRGKRERAERGESAQKQAMAGSGIRRSHIFMPE